MFKNHFKIAFRNLVNNKVQSFINVAGLSVGMAVAMLIGLWIRDELSFNSYHKNHDSIAQIARKEITNGDAYIAENINNMPIPLAAELRNSYGNYFKRVALVSHDAQHVLSFNNNQFFSQGLYAEPDFPGIFTLKMLAGTSSHFNEPNTILLNESLSHSLFGNMDPVGQVLKLDNKLSLKVMGVFEDISYNAKFSDISFVCPLSLLINSEKNVRDIVGNWNNSSFQLFVQAAPGISMDKISNTIQDVYWSKIEHRPGEGVNDKTTLFLYPMKDWHLRSEWKNGVHAGGRIAMVWLFGIIGIFVLLLACINFMNLSTARSEKRAKEVGIRKTLGSLRSQLVKQFLSESFLVVLLSFLLSLAIVVLSLNWFNGVADKRISFPLGDPICWIVSVSFIILTAILAGIYPALYLSSFQPVKVLKGVFRTSHLVARPRQIMVTLQFTFSILLIIGTIVVYRQIRYAQNRPVGYNKNGLISIAMNTPDLFGKYDVLRKELLESGGAVGFAQSSAQTTEKNYFDDHFEWEGKDAATKHNSFSLMGVTVDYGKTVGWQFLQGRDFIKNFSADAAGIVLNEAALQYMGLKDPIGKIVKWNNNPYAVVGVIKNMITGSPYEPVQQSLFFLVPGVGPVIMVRLNPLLSSAEAIRKIAPVFRSLNPSSPFDYKFVDEEYGKKFAAEQRVGILSTIFAGLAIFISCLGIFGLASFVAEQRTKEIGVRKVLGATVINLWGLLSREFVLLVALAFVIAAPIAWYFMHEWLEKYEYHTNITWWIFALSGSGALAITLLTVSYQTIRAALMNPVRSLRSE